MEGNFVLNDNPHIVDEYRKQNLDHLYDDVVKKDSEAIKTFKNTLENIKDLLPDPDNSTKSNARRQWMFNEILKLSKNSKILDIGPWSGAFSAEVYNNGYHDITCLEIRKDCVSFGKAKYPFLKWIQGDVEEYQTDEKYDLIIMGEVLEHLVNPLLAIEKARNWLTEDGIIQFTVPTAETVFGKEKERLLEHISQISFEDLLEYSNDIDIFTIPNSEFEWYVGTIPKKRKEKEMKEKKVEKINEKIKIAFLDILGLKYDGDTLNKRGLGGSESAIIYMSRELVKLGFDVTVYCKTETDGIYDGVNYISLGKCRDNTTEYDILITSRSCLPYAPSNLREVIWEENKYDLEWISAVVDKSKYKILWLHDTFCSGDKWLEHFCLDGYFDEIFALSDWHSNYIMNGHTWRGRIFEVLKNKLWETRNGLQNYVDEVDIREKDKNLYVYNSSVTKGMIPLLENCWDEILKINPEAKLMVIGGYYRGASATGPDEQELKWTDLKDRHDGKNGVTFTGIISQKEIGEILAKSYFMIYPAVFPETYGISTLEAINYNVPLIGCRFGALEEVAAGQTSFLINYAIHYDENQIKRFIGMFRMAYNDPYLVKQKMYACNEFKPFIGWDSVALQWKQHFYKKLDLYMPLDELRKVNHINRNVQRIFERRFLNKEDIIESTSEQRRFAIITPVYNAEKYIAKCINSVANQLYDNYYMLIIDDASTDNTVEIAEKTIATLPNNIKNKFTIFENNSKQYAVTNQRRLIEQSTDPSDIIILLDGDDWLVNDNYIFNYLDDIYSDERYDMTYGSCHSLIDNINLISEPYPQEVNRKKSYRQYLFHWGMPYTHLRTFRRTLFDKIDKKLLKDEKGEDWGAGGDNALFYALIEKAFWVKCIQRILMVYNDTNPLNDYKVNKEEQNINAKKIREQGLVNKEIEQVDKKEKIEIKDKEVQIVQNKKEPIKVLIGIPTAKNIESNTFKSIYNLINPGYFKISFECFYGYTIDQVRNLMMHYTLRNNFDYILNVDSDIVLPQNALVKLHSDNKQIVSGIYRQRNMNENIPELYIFNEGMKRVDPESLEESQLLEVSACGFGCTLMTRQLIEKIGYPQFIYHHTIDFSQTLSEDTHFCQRTRECGHKVYVDTAVRCGHIGTFELKI